MIVFLTLCVSIFSVSVVNAETQTKYVIKLATVAPQGTPWSDQMTDLKKRIEKESKGRIEVKVYLGGSLGGEVETLRSLLRKDPRIHAWAGSTGALASILPSMQLIELPYLFENDKEVDYILDDVLFKPFHKQLLDKGLVLNSWNENGW